MKLFFETATQAEAFLLTVPLGFLLAACFDATSALKKGRTVLDVVLLLICAVALVRFIHILKGDGLRAYHLLALFIGAILYLRGMGRLIRGAVSWLRKAKSDEKTIRN